MIYSIYFGRFSSKAQELGDSQRRQDGGFEAHLTRTQSTAWAERYFDNGVSGWDRDGSGGQHRKTGAFGRLLADISAQTFPVGSIIWFENLDRFGREDPYDYTIPTFRKILRSGYTITIGSDTFLPSQVNDMRLIGLVCQALGNKAQSDKTSERLGQHHAQTRAAGNRTTKKNLPSAACPKWISVVDGKYVLNAFAKTMKEACLMSIDGHGFKSVQAALGVNESIKRTWHARSLVGEWTACKRPSKSKRIATGECHKIYPALLSEAEYQALQVAITRRTVAGKPRGDRNPSSNLFRDLAFSDDGLPLMVTYRDVKRAGKAKVSLKVMKRNNRIGGDMEYLPFEAEILNNCLLNLSSQDLTPRSNQPNILAEIEAKLVRCDTRIDEAMAVDRRQTSFHFVLPHEKMLPRFPASFRLNSAAHGRNRSHGDPLAAEVA